MKVLQSAQVCGVIVSLVFSDSFVSIKSWLCIDLELEKHEAVKKLLLNEV